MNSIICHQSYLLILLSRHSILSSGGTSGDALRTTAFLLALCREEPFCGISAL